MTPTQSDEQRAQELAEQIVRDCVSTTADGELVSYPDLLQALLLPLVQDSARYRWERENPAWETEAFLMNMSPEEYDAAIDRARAASNSAEGEPSE